MAIQLLTMLMLAAPAQAEAPETVTISDCYDGDTCRTTDVERIRLACIDTPELRGKRADPVPAMAARDHLRGMGVGRSVGLRRIMIDRKGRAVAELFFDEMNVQLAMITCGNAEIDWH